MLPLAIIIAIIGIVAAIGIEEFESMLLDKNPFMVGSLSVLIGTVFFLFHKVIGRLQ